MTVLATPLFPRADLAFAEQAAATGEPAAQQPTPFSVNLIKQGPDKLKLKGLVASKDDHKAVLGLVKASFPAADVTDRIKIADGPKTDLKLGNISFALKALNYIDTGSARVEEQTVTLSGHTDSRADYEEIKTLIDNGRPNGIAVTDQITEPTAFSWRAEVGNGKVKLTGAVPDSVDKKQLESTVSKLFSGLEIVDNTYVADGAPESWLDAAVHSLQVLKLLNSGYVVVADHSVQLDGHAKDEATLRKIDALADKYPIGFALETKVSIPAMRASMWGVGLPQFALDRPSPAPNPAETAKQQPTSALVGGAAPLAE